MPASLRETRVQIGVDLILVGRIARLLAENAAAAEGIFTSRELAYCLGTTASNERLAGRFAAKEAVLKALGTGITDGVDIAEVEIRKHADGRPWVELRGEAARRAEASGVIGIEVSMAHSGGLAIATAVATLAATASD